MLGFPVKKTRNQLVFILVSSCLYEVEKKNGDCVANVDDIPRIYELFMPLMATLRSLGGSGDYPRN